VFTTSDDEVKRCGKCCLSCDSHSSPERELSLLLLLQPAQNHHKLKDEILTFYWRQRRLWEEIQHLAAVVEVEDQESEES
jgi:hypothetical protein